MTPNEYELINLNKPTGAIRRFVSSTVRAASSFRCPQPQLQAPATSPLANPLSGEDEDGRGKGLVDWLLPPQRKASWTLKLPTKKRFTS